MRKPKNYLDFSAIIEDGMAELGTEESAHIRVWENDEGEVWVTPSNIVEPSAEQIDIEWDGAVWVRAEEDPQIAEKERLAQEAWEYEQEQLAKKFGY